MEFECPNSCHRYRQSMSEIVEAGNKHKEKAIAIKEIAEEQKRKISILREEKNSLLDDVEQLEFDARNKNEIMRKMNVDMKALKI